MIISKNEFDAVLVWNKKLLTQYGVLMNPKAAEEDLEKEKIQFIKAMKRLRPKSPIKPLPSREDEENGNAK